MSFCAPSRENNGWTCFSIEELDVMARAWNKTRLGKKYPISLNKREGGEGNDADKRKKFLWTSLRDRFIPFCGENEACWLDSIELGKQLKEISPTIYKIVNYFTLKPKGTKGKHDWLSTTEIDYVLNQYEKIYPHFKYIGCFPSDYYKLSPTKFPSKILDTYDNAAIVFNLDESHQKGSHWVAVFFDRTSMGQRVVEYFDPTADRPNKNISAFFKHPYFSDAIFKQNRKPHQKGNNECGVYSIYYILARLRGQPFEELGEKNAPRIPDSDMNAFRAYLFRPYSESYSMDS